MLSAAAEQSGAVHWATAKPYLPRNCAPRSRDRLRPYLFIENVNRPHPHPLPQEREPRFPALGNAPKQC
jgi:hypothetical protein